MGEPTFGPCLPRIAPRVLGLVVWLTLAFVPLAAVGQQRDSEGFPVRIDDVELFRIRHDLGPVTAEDRARIVQQKIHDLTFNPFRPAGDYELRELDARTDVVFGDLTITTVTDEDAAAEGAPRHELAAQRLALVQDAVETRRAVLWHPRRLAIGLLASVRAIRAGGRASSPVSCTSSRPSRRSRYWSWVERPTLSRRRTTTLARYAAHEGSTKVTRTGVATPRKRAQASVAFVHSGKDTPLVLEAGGRTVKKQSPQRQLF